MTTETPLRPPAAPRTRPARETATALPALLAAGLLAAACASQPPASSPDPGSEPPAAAAEAVASAEPAVEADAPPDPSTLYVPPYSGAEVILSPEGDWFVDENGFEYYKVEVERRPEFKVFSTVDGTAVMLPPGAAYQVVEEREDTVVIKILNRHSLPEPPPRKPAPDRSASLTDLEALAVETTDSLRLERLGRGLPGRGQWRQGFELVDMNGDGHLDIVHGPARKSDSLPKIFLGDGEGGWRLWREARFEGKPLDYGDVAVADFNGDGALDLAFAVHLRGLQVMVGDGRGRFRQWGEGLPYRVPGAGEEPGSFSSRTVEAVDWDRDGRPDLLTLGEGPRLVRDPGATNPDVSHGERGPILFLNRGDGRWERYDQGTGRRQLFGDGLAVGDFDGDGLADFAVASRVRGATHLVKIGQQDGSWEDVSLGDLARPGVFGAVLAIELDGDGRDELLLGYGVAADGESWWIGIDRLELEDGQWRRTPVVAKKGVRSGVVTALASGDVDGDGRSDLVALTDAGERWVLLGDAGGGYVQEESAELAPDELDCQGYAVEVARLGEAGRPVVIMGFAGETGSEQIIPGLEKRCPSGGSLEAWTPAPASRPASGS